MANLKNFINSIVDERVSAYPNLKTREIASYSLTARQAITHENNFPYDSCGFFFKSGTGTGEYRHIYFSEPALLATPYYRYRMLDDVSPTVFCGDLTYTELPAYTSKLTINPQDYSGKVAFLTQVAGENPIFRITELDMFSKKLLTAGEFPVEDMFPADDFAYLSVKVDPRDAEKDGKSSSNHALKPAISTVLTEELTEFFYALVDTVTVNPAYACFINHVVSDYDYVVIPQAHTFNAFSPSFSKSGRKINTARSVSPRVWALYSDLAHELQEQGVGLYTVPINDSGILPDPTGRKNRINIDPILTNMLKSVNRDKPSGSASIVACNPLALPKACVSAWVNTHGARDYFENLSAMYD